MASLFDLIDQTSGFLSNSQNAAAERWNAAAADLGAMTEAAREAAS